MKNKLFEYFCARTAIFAALSLLISAFSVSIVNGQTGKARANSDQPEAVFTNPATITIPAEGNANPYPSTINVSGLTGTISTAPGSVKVTLNGLSHTFPNDLGIVLVGPTGAALLLQSSVTLGSNAGNPASNVTYTISDSGATRLPADTPLTPGTFKPTAYFTGDSFPAPGPGTNYAHPGPDGGASATFSSVFGGTNPNGNWNLFIRDFVSGDSGSVSGGWTLEIITGGGQPFDNRLNYIGSDLADWAVLNAPAGGNVTWLIARNDNPTPVNGRFFSIPFGLSSDQAVAFGDWTGDGLTDLSTWRPTEGRYWILPSNTAKPAPGGAAFNIPWGTSGDLTNREGDYDGDGKMDPTVIRTDSGARRWFVLRSGTNTFSTFVFGASATDTPIAGADYTGDGADDPAVIRLTASNEILWLIGTTSGALINQVQWGNYNTDFIIPAGDYDGDSKADLTVWRGFGSSPAVNGEWLILKSGGGVTNIQWGIPGPGDTNPNRDIALRSGDYDGDKKTDIAVWRPSNQTFYVLRSTNGQLMQQKWGFSDSDPVAAFGTF